MFDSFRRVALAGCPLATAALVLLLSSPPATAQLRLVAASGQQVPGANAGTTFASVQLSGINSLGQTALIADLESDSGGAPSPAGSAIFVEHDGIFRTVARQGDDAPGAPAGFAFDAFPYAVLNDAGRVALVANYSPDGSGSFNGPGYGGPGYGTWSEAGGALQPVVLRDEPMPGASGPAASAALFREISTPAFNTAGDAAFVSSNVSCDSAGTNTCYQGAFLERNTQLAKLAITLDTAPVVGGEFYLFPFAADFGFPGIDVTVALNDLGQAAFVAYVDVVNGPSYDSLWLASGGALTPVIVEGSPTPGGPAGAVFDSEPFGEVPAINNAGQLAVKWHLRGGGINNSNSLAIWSGLPGALRLVARTDDPAPGTADKFTNLGDPLINADGDISFSASIGTSGSGLWVDRNGELKLVAVTGQAVLGLPDGTVFDNFYSEPAINAAGQIAIHATLKQGQGGVTDANDQGLWVQNQDGALVLIARKGDSVDVDAGPGVDMRMFSSFSIRADAIFLGGGSGNEDGRASFFNDRGQLAFWAAFTDGSNAVLISDAAVVPEPAVAIHVFCLVVGGILARGRRRRLN